MKSLLYVDFNIDIVNINEDTLVPDTFYDVQIDSDLVLA